MTNSQKAISSLARELGDSRIKSDDYVRAAYSSDGMPAFPTAMADAVVYPTSTEEVQAIIRTANELKVPLIPMGGRLSAFRMIEIEKGGILLDLCEMDKLIQLDEENQSITVQAGMSDYMVDQAMRAKGYRLMVHPMGQAAAICAASEVAKDSLGIYGCMSGPQDHWVLGLKVVLGNGDILETGASRVFGAPHFTRYHIPDLTGVFMASEGSLGIITEVTFRMAKLAESTVCADFNFSDNGSGLRDLCRAAREIRSRELVKQGMYWSPPSCQSWYERCMQYHAMPAGGFDPTSLGEHTYDRYKHMFSVVVESLYSEEDAELKNREVRAICEKYNGEYTGALFGEVLSLEDGAYGKDGREIHTYQLCEFGSRLNWHWTWLQAPYDTVADFDALCPPTFEKAGLCPEVSYHAAYFTPYSAILAAYTHYDPSNPGERKKVQKWCDIIIEDCYSKIGAIPANTGRTLRSYSRKSMDPAYLSYMSKIKGMFDPNGIMNPGVSIF